MARKLAAILHAMWKTNDLFRHALLQPDKEIRSYQDAVWWSPEKREHTRVRSDHGENLCPAGSATTERGAIDRND